jgi:hypothetical protein
LRELAAVQGKKAHTPILNLIPDRGRSGFDKGRSSVNLDFHSFMRDFQADVHARGFSNAQRQPADDLGNKTCPGNFQFVVSNR